jgi:hypothetical protein
MKTRMMLGDKERRISYRCTSRGYSKLCKKNGVFLNTFQPDKCSFNQYTYVKTESVFELQRSRRNAYRATPSSRLRLQRHMSSLVPREGSGMTIAELDDFSFQLTMNVCRQSYKLNKDRPT